MLADKKGSNGDLPIDDLSPRLREAVQRIVRRPAPEGLMRQTIQRLRELRPAASRVARRRVAAMVALAAAAGIAGAVLLWQFRDRGNGRPQWAQEPPPRPPIPVAQERETVTETPARWLDPMPTLWAYHQAARQAPEALDALLERHADQLTVEDPESLWITASGHSAKETL